MSSRKLLGTPRIQYGLGRLISITKPSEVMEPDRAKLIAEGLRAIASTPPSKGY